MKFLALILTLVLTACGTEHSEPKQTRFEANLPASFGQGTITTEGVTLGNGDCKTVWPKVMPYEVDGAGVYHVNGEEYAPVVGQDKTWAYAGKRVNGWLPVTVFTVGDGLVFVRLECSYKEPIEHAL